MCPQAQWRVLQTPSAAWAPTPACPSTGSVTGSATVPTGATSSPQRAVVGLHVKKKKKKSFSCYFMLFSCPLCWWRVLTHLWTHGEDPSQLFSGWHTEAASWRSGCVVCHRLFAVFTGENFHSVYWWKSAPQWLYSFIALPEENAPAHVKEVMGQEGRCKFCLQFILANCSDTDISCPIKCYFQSTWDTFPWTVSEVQ